MRYSPAKVGPIVGICAPSPPFVLLEGGKRGGMTIVIRLRDRHDGMRACIRTGVSLIVLIQCIHWHVGDSWEGACPQRLQLPWDDVQIAGDVPEHFAIGPRRIGAWRTPIARCEGCKQGMKGLAGPFSFATQGDLESTNRRRGGSIPVHLYLL